LNFEDAIYTLQNWPLSWIAWETDNSERLDVFWDPDLNRDDTKDLLTLLPWDERNFFQWNSDPYGPGPEGNGLVNVILLLGCYLTGWPDITS